MSSTSYFRRRTMGRAASPPTWACYEQIQDDYSDSDSCSEDEEDYNEDSRDRDSSDTEQPPPSNAPAPPPPAAGSENSDDIDMDMDEDGSGGAQKEMDSEKQKDMKGKQRAVDPEPEPVPRRQRKKQQRVYTLRPILTIHKSQGFVWNQDLFVPPYIKDRYIASTSPPNARGFVSSSASSNNSAMTDYEVEVVEIRVREGEIFDIIP